MNLWSFDQHSSVQLNLFERYIVTGPTLKELLCLYENVNTYLYI